MAFEPEANFMPFEMEVLPVHDHFSVDFFQIERSPQKIGRGERVKYRRCPDARYARMKRKQSAHFLSS
jgi:hypothetical protein